MNDPVYLTLGLHAHQPVGNFGHVFEEHLEQVYGPFLDQAVQGGLLPLTLHLSGPLLDWLEANNAAYLDRVGELVDEGNLELLLAGYYEPILPSLLKEDRVEQIQWMQEALRSRFGTEARGLWLTERVWEPDLAEDLVDAGVEYLLVDDRHFSAAGFSRDQLHRPFRTEFGGKSLGVFAIDETLRYFLPFRPPEDTAAYLRDLHSSGERLAVAADDIEKFGGWPGTREWVYEKGWLRDFTRALDELRADGTVTLATLGQAFRDLPSGGMAYLPSGSYREMEEWTLPPEAFRRLETVKEALERAGLSGGESPLLRGSHWRNFLVRYPEADRMHKKALELSRICRDRGNPREARRAIGRAQCNDAYWHGVFGGLYLRHLRDTVWRNLSEAEGLLRSGERLAVERLDLDLDGDPELWIHSSAFSALVSPSRGGTVEELTLFDLRINLANTLTRRREAYHFQGDSQIPADGDEGPVENETGQSPGTPSIHDLEGALTFSRLPPVDAETRALFVDRVLPGDSGPETFRNGGLVPLLNVAGHRLHVSAVEEITRSKPSGDRSGDGRSVTITLEDPSWPGFRKQLSFDEDGALEVTYRWDPSGFPSQALFTTELSLGGDTEVLADPPSSLWRFPVSTFSKSEKGFDETIQGESVTVQWPILMGRGKVRIQAR